MTDRPIGPLVTGFHPPAAPVAEVAGHYVLLEALDPARHAEPLFAASQGQDWLWDYMPYGPFATLDAYRDWQGAMAGQADPWFYAIRDRRTGAVSGVASYLRIDRANGVIEIGHILIAPRMQRSASATEAIMLMIRWAFEAGYRRVEWKCNALNTPSMRAARRYGFTYEGTFRQHLIVKGRNRDSAWFSILDSEWPELRYAYDRWLSPGNFAPDGSQRERLSDLVPARPQAL